MRRTGADGPRKQRFGEVDQLRVRHEVFGRSCAALQRVRGKRIVGATLAEKTSQQRDQLIDRRVAAQRFGAGTAGLDMRIDEQRRLLLLREALSREQRHGNISADVAEETPEQAMRNVVKTREAKKFERLAHLDAEPAFIDKRNRQPAGLSERGQEQGVHPYRKSRDKAADRTSARR